MCNKDDTIPIHPEPSESGAPEMKDGMVKLADHRAAAVLARSPAPSLDLQTPPHPLAIVERALAGGLAPEVLEKLMALAERWEAKEAAKAYADAFAKFKEECPVIRKDKHVKVRFWDDKKKRMKDGPEYDHASLGEIGKTVDPLLGKHGLATNFKQKQEKGVCIITCICRHKLGHQETFTMEAPPDTGPGRNTIQAIKSTFTYLRRATIEGVLGITTGDDDDDGAGAGPTDGKKPQRDSEDPTPQSEQSEDPAPADDEQSEQLGERPASAIRLLKHWGVMREDIERKLGVSARDWTDEHYKRMEAWRTAFQAVPRQKWPEVLQQIFEPEPGSKG